MFAHVPLGPPILEAWKGGDLSYWTSQSSVTAPGAMARQLTDLPTELPALRRSARGLVIHYRAEHPLAHGIPTQRMAEIDSRYGGDPEKYRGQDRVSYRVRVERTFEYGASDEPEPGR